MYIGYWILYTGIYFSFRFEASGLLLIYGVTTYSRMVVNAFYFYVLLYVYSNGILS
jgi:hypothetical protein